MAQVDNKRPSMTLYMEPRNIISHWICFVLAEKSIEPNIIFVDHNKPPKDLLRVNPVGILPTLLDREGLLLYRPAIIAEYLEERFPHPPLLSVYPVRRARCRQMIDQIEHKWHPLVKSIASGNQAEQAQKLLQERLLSLAPLFKTKPYCLLSDELSLVDCLIAPILWYLEQRDIDLLEGVKPLVEYKNRLFEGAAFQASLNTFNPNEVV
jgi:RNA polymerase-associated protein